MRRSTIALCCIVALYGSAGAAKAESLDLDKVTCKDFLASSKEDMAYTLAWLDGFYKDEDAPSVIDFDKLKANSGKLGAYCAAHPDDTVGDAADELFGNN